jgi:hypothetical protein
MSSVWLRIDDVQAQPWAMRMVPAAQEAALLGSGDAQQAVRGAVKEVPRYSWQSVPIYLRNAFVVQGLLK